MRKYPFFAGLVLLAWATRLSAQAPAATAAVEPGPAREVIMSFGSSDLAGFERNAATAKELGATHVVITDDIPTADWQFAEAPNDPYPAWYVGHPSVLEIFPPKDLAPFVDRDYVAKVGQILEQRCAILRKYGLKAAWNSNEPHVLPEAFFVAHPEMRGPQVDQPNRARVPHFAPCTDRPEVLQMYRDALKALLTRCPEIEIFNFVTTDAGSGFSWAPGLYPGANGPGWCKDRPLEQRVAEFLLNWQQGGKDAGHTLEVNITQIAPRSWMIPTFAEPMNIVRLLPRGLAVNNLEGPDGRTFMARSGSERSPFYPLEGVAVPSLAAGGGRSNAARQWVSFGDETVQDFNVRLFKATRDVPSRNEIERLTQLRAFAVTEAGEAHADDLLALWLALNDVQRQLDGLDFGPLFRMGVVLGRWIDRPLVPYPQELTAAEKSYYRPYLLQAKGEDQADDVANIQAMDMYEGWGARLLFQRVIEITMPRVREAIRNAARLRDTAAEPAARARWELLDQRLEAMAVLLLSSENMIKYQAQLNRVHALGVKPEAAPVLGTQGGWDRADLMQIARDEVDNALQLRALILAAQGPIIDTAPMGDGETIMRLGPNLPDELKQKVDIMLAHWKDYDRMFTPPNQ